jgi:hypothetical protein
MREKAARKQTQLTLFEMKHDTRPETQRSADGRYSQPLLFESQPRREGKLHRS